MRVEEEVLAEAGPEVISSSAGVIALDRLPRERRVVSVLFVDLVGFTSLAEGRDPEEVRELLTRYFDNAKTTIQRYGGTVEKFIGDAVMAVWGTPVTHEDDAERSVRAALDLLETVTSMGRSMGIEDLNARAGIMTGETAVRLDASGQGMVAGDLVNTASRLQSIAAPGTVLVGKGTYASARNAIEFEEAGTHELNGKLQSVPAWRALSVVAGQGDVGRIHRIEPPFVGRQDELRALKSTLLVGAKERRLQIVFLFGIDGIGKSRLVWELFKYADSLAEPVFWHQGRARAYGEDVTFLPLAEIVRARLQIADTDDSLAVRTKLSAALDVYVADEEERGWIEPHLELLLGLQQETVADSHELFAAIRTFFDRISEMGTTVLVFDDIQWADDGLFDFLDHLVDYSSARPIVVLGVARPELLDRRAAWISGLEASTSIHLDPLADEAMTRLLKGMAVSEEVVAPIVKRADGVPLYAVETVRMLLDEARIVQTKNGLVWKEPSTEIEVPESLNALVATRLDVLPHDERSVIGDAAVLGPIFSLAALAAIRDESPTSTRKRLTALVRRELLALDADDPRSAHRTIYGFIGSLIPDVSYQMLSKNDRYARHLAAAAYFEGGRQGDPGLAAAHYLKALSNAPDDAAAANVATRAIQAHVVAARRHNNLGSHMQAVARIEQALQIANDHETGPDAARLHELAADFCLKASDTDRAEEHLAVALAWHEEQGDPSPLARVSAKLGGVQMSRASRTQGMQRLEAGLGALVGMDSLASDPGNPRLAVMLADALLADGMAVQATEWAEKALAAAEKLDQTSVVSAALITKALAADAAGRWRESLGMLVGANAVAEEFNLSHVRLSALLALSDVWQLIQPSRAIAEAERAGTLAGRLGLRTEESSARASAGWIALWSEGDAGVRRILKAADGEDMAAARPVSGIISAAAANVLSGHLADALSELAQLDHSDDSPMNHWIAEIHLLDEILSGDRRRAAMEAMASWRDDPQTRWGVRILAHAGRASLWDRDARGVEAALEAIERVPWASTPWARLTLKGLRAGLEGLSGNHDGSLSGYREAIAAADEMGASLDAALLHADLAHASGIKGDSLSEGLERASQRLSALGAHGLWERINRSISTESSGRLKRGELS